MNKNNFKKCAIYGTNYPIKYLLNAFKDKIQVDYIIENKVDTYEGIQCYGRDDLPYKETDVILISDIVVEDIIREKFRKNHITIPCYSMTELL